MQQLRDNTFLSIVIPIYNEERRILPTLQKIVQFIRANNIECQMVVVDDGSQDRSLSIIQDFFGSDYHLKVIQGRPNRGKGWAVQQGMLAAAGEWIIFMDADLSVPVETLNLFLKKIKEGWDIVIGSRRVPGAQITQRQPYLREQLGKQFTKISNLILGTQFKDFTCGFKLFKKEAARLLFTDQQLWNWSFDSEILFLAKKRGLKIVEYPVQWTNSKDTKVQLFKDIPASFWGLLKIRYLH